MTDFTVIYRTKSGETKSHDVAAIDYTHAAKMVEKIASHPYTIDAEDQWDSLVDVKKVR